MDFYKKSSTFFGSSSSSLLEQAHALVAISLERTFVVIGAVVMDSANESALTVEICRAATFILHGADPLALFVFD